MSELAGHALPSPPKFLPRSIGAISSSLFKQLGEIKAFKSGAIMNKLQAHVLSSQGAQLTALGKWHGLLRIFSLPAPTADTHTAAVVGTKSRKGGKKKWELPRQSPSPLNLWSEVSSKTFAGEVVI